jgi:hypothetical protein
MDIQVHPNVSAIFAVSVTIIVVCIMCGSAGAYPM